MSKVVWSWALAVILVISGCAIGPDYEKSKPLTPDGWNEATRAGMNSGPANVTHWWKNFQDPVLSALIEKGLASGTDMRLAVAKVRQARAERGVVATGLFPSLNANGSFTRSHSPGASAESSDSTQNLKSASNQFKAGLETSWEVDLWGRLRRNTEAADADLGASIEDARAIQVTLVADIGTAYANYRGFQKQLEIARRSLETQKKTAEIIQKRYRAGYTNGLDTSNADAQVATTQSQIPTIETAESNALNSLTLLVGKETASLLQGTTNAELPMIPVEVPIGLPSDLLLRRPDIRRSEAQVHAATARIGVAKGDYFPKFSINGSYGYASSDRKLIGNPRVMSWSFGPSLSLPIFDIARVRWNVEAQNAIQEQTLINHEKTLQIAFGEVEISLVAYAGEKERQRYLLIAMQKNERSVEIAKKLYLVGKTDFLNLGSAQNALYSAENSMAQSQRDLIIDLISLYRALGGGWQETDAN